MERLAVAATCAGLLAAGVIDFAAADSVIGRGRVAAPADMKQLIERYDAGVRDRIYAVVKAVTAAQSGARPAYVHDFASLKTMPPISA